MPRPKKDDLEAVSRPWRIVAKHGSTGMEFRGSMTEDQFREVQKVLFGDQLALPVGE